MKILKLPFILLSLVLIPISSVLAMEKEDGPAHYIRCLPEFPIDKWGDDIERIEREFYYIKGKNIKELVFLPDIKELVSRYGGYYFSGKTPELGEMRTIQIGLHATYLEEELYKQIPDDDKYIVTWNGTYSDGKWVIYGIIPSCDQLFKIVMEPNYINKRGY